MFERYTEKARRAIFFGRYEASHFGSRYIEAEHLLLGMLREDKALAHRFLRTSATVESIRKQIEGHTTTRDKVSTSVDLPLSHQCKRVLGYAAEEADRLNHKHIGTEHLLLGLLREGKCFAAEILHERGLRLAQMREELAAHANDSSVRPVEREQLLRTTLLSFFQSLGQGLIAIAAESRIFVSQDGRGRARPFLCIEILSPTESLRDLRDRVADDLVAGVRYVWLLDAETHHVYTLTREGGLQEFQGPVLRTENPAVELPLAEIFA